MGGTTQAALGVRFFMPGRFLGMVRTAQELADRAFGRYPTDREADCGQSHEAQSIPAEANGLKKTHLGAPLRTSSERKYERSLSICSEPGFLIVPQAT